MSIREKIIKVLSNEDASVNGSSQAVYSFVDAFKQNPQEPVTVEDLTFHMVESYFGFDEDDSKDIWVVFHLEGDETLFRLEGHYNFYMKDEWLVYNIHEVVKMPRVIYYYVERDKAVNLKVR